MLRPALAVFGTCAFARFRLGGVNEIGRVLIWLGALLVVIGLVVVAAGKFGLPLGRLPGDIVYRGKNTSFYFPLATSILVSVILSLVVWVVQRIRR